MSEESPLDQPETPKPEDPMVISYRGLRKAIGLIGIALPIALVVVGNLFGDLGIRDSISSYYWSVELARDVLVGSLCSIGVFLLSYQGVGWKDNWAGNLACIFAVGVAMCPCSKVGEPRTWSNDAHYAFAAGLFLMLAYFCMVSFTKSDPGMPPLPKKPLRNKIYRACGIIIILCIASIALIGFFPSDHWIKNYVFWFEATAIWSFGWSWYIKGKGLGLVQG